MSTQSDLAELYTTFFNRAPDADGLTYWVNQITAGQISLTQIAENWMTQQPEGQTTFPSTLTDAQFIDKIYGNILGRASDAEGAQYWLDQLAGGALGRDAFAATLINGAKSNTSAQGVLDSALISNKATVGIAFADKGLNDTTLAAKVLTSVTADTNTLNATLAVISLVPASAAAQSPIVLATANQLLNSLAALISAAPAELADAAIYLQTLANNATSATNFTTLLTNATVLLSTAASNPAALDNPATQGSAAVVAATPVVVTPNTKFFVTETANHELVFGGTEKGQVSVRLIDGDNIVFGRGLETAQSISLKTVVKLDESVSYRLYFEGFKALESKLTAANDVTVADPFLTAAQVADLSALANVDIISSPWSFIFTKAQYDVVTLANKYSGSMSVDGQGNSLSAADAVTISANTHVTAIINTTLVLDKTQYATAPKLHFHKGNHLSVVDDTLSAEEAMSISQDDAVDVIGVATQTFNASQLSYLIGKLRVEDSITLADTSGSIANTLNSYIDNLDKIDAVEFLDSKPEVLVATAALYKAISNSSVDFGVPFYLVDSNYSTDDLVAWSADDHVYDIQFTNGMTKAQYDLGLKKVSLDKVVMINDNSLSADEVLALNDDPGVYAIINNSVTYDKTNYVDAPSKLLMTIKDDTLTGQEVYTFATSSSVHSVESGAVTLTVDQFMAAIEKMTVPANSITLTGSADAFPANVLAFEKHADVIKSIDLSGHGITLSAASAEALGDKLINPGDVVTINVALYEGTHAVSSKAFQAENDKLAFNYESLANNFYFTSYTGNTPELEVQTSKGLVNIALVNGDKATEAGAAFVFDSATGVLSFDPDGNAATGFDTPSTPLLTLTGTNTLSLGNFVIPVIES